MANEDQQAQFAKLVTTNLRNSDSQTLNTTDDVSIYGVE
jgi:hypothetical protein